MLSRLLVLSLLAMVVSVPMARAESDLPLPRFVTLKSEKANIRQGPGLRYPIKWVFIRPNLPLEVIAEFEHWRKIRDIQGDEGWIHRSMLSNKRSVIITGGIQTMRRTAAPTSEPVALAENGVNASLLSCTRTICRIQIEKTRGWVPRSNLWGIYPTEMLE